MGLPLSPQEEAAIKTRSQTERPQIYTDPLTNKTVVRPSPWFTMGGAQQMAQQAPQQDAQMPQRQQAIAAQSDVTQVQPLLMDEQQDVSESPYKAPAELGARGKVMEAEFERDVSLAQRKSDIQFRKEQMKSKKGRERVTGIIEKSMADLERLNDELKAKQAIISNDMPLLKRLENKYGTTWLGRQTGSVSDPDIEAKRKEYEVIRDSLIPSYIAYNELPATVVDTEEFQKRILQSFGDPSLSYEANQSALSNMRSQFKLPAKTPSDQERPQITREQALQMLKERGRL